MTALYCFMWYPQLNKEVLEFSEDVVVSTCHQPFMQSGDL
jgi:hypothetical protein